MRNAALSSLLLWLVLASSSVHAAEFLIRIGDAQRRYDTATLLARPDAAEITVPDDVAYGRTMTYRAVPLHALLDGLTVPPGQMLEAVATDGFTATLPADLVRASGPAGSVAWLAVEPSDRPWPPIPGKTETAGPFYIVWLNPAVAGVRSEQWPYQVARVMSADAPVDRWPQIAVDPSLPPNSPARAGLPVFVTQCMACHPMNGGGNATMGPDLNLPMNPTEYFAAGILPVYIRNPAAIRHWPGQKMPSFTPAMVTDRELADVVAYLTHMAGRKAKP